MNNIIFTNKDMVEVSILAKDVYEKIRTHGICYAYKVATIKYTESVGTDRAIDLLDSNYYRIGYTMADRIKIEAGIKCIALIHGADVDRIWWWNGDRLNDEQARLDTLSDIIDYFKSKDKDEVFFEYYG